MKQVIYSLAALSLCVPLTTDADRVDVADCKNIEMDSKRLACYDSFFGNISPEEISREVAGPATGESLKKLPPDSRDEENRIEEFGAEQVKLETPKHIEARLVGVFNGWTGKTTFTLDNNQVWRQINNNVKDYKPRAPMNAPKVTISKSFFGSYNFRVEGVKRIIQVKRIK